MVYCDGIFDLPHYGHARSFQKIRTIAAEHFRIAPERIRVLVGITGGDLSAYKRIPVMPLDSRVAMTSALRDVDAVIPDAENPITQSFMDKHHIDLVMHGSDFSEEKADYYYGVARQQGKYLSFPYE